MSTTKKAIVINSSDRISGTPSNFIIQFNNNTRQYQKCTSFYVRSVMINNSFYVVNSSNNQFIFTTSSQKYTFTITPGNYSYSDLVSTIQPLLDSISSSAWTISYSNITCSIPVNVNSFDMIYYSDNNNQNV